MSSPQRVEPPRDIRLQSRWELMSYALSRLPPKQLPFLAFYAYGVLYASRHKWINTESVGRAAQAIVSVLSMATITSQSSPSASSPIDLGDSERDQLLSDMDEPDLPPLPKPRAPVPRAVSATRRITRSTASMTPEPEPEHPPTPPPAPPRAIKSPARSETANSTWSKKGKERDLVGERVDELAGLFVGFAFALQHHLHGTRPLPQAPLIDLLPSSYLSSLKRTEARVRFASSHAGPSGSTSLLGLSDMAPMAPSPSAQHSADPNRPGLRRRGTGPPTKAEREAAGVGDDEDWDLGTLRQKAENAVSKLAEAMGGTNGEADKELVKQLRQLNRYSGDSALLDDGEIVDLSLRSPGSPGSPGMNGSAIGGSPKPKSNLTSPNPSNLPLSLLKLMEIYCMGLAEVSKDKGGWSEPKRDRALAVVAKLGLLLGDAERLGSGMSASGVFEGGLTTDPPPLPLTIHLTDLLLIYLAALPCAMLLTVEGWRVVVVTVLAGWCLLGLEALVSEVGGVFGGSENHHPLPLFTREILLESIEISPSFNRYYRSRVVGRVGEGDGEVDECDRRIRRGGGGGDEWVPTFE